MDTAYFISDLHLSHKKVLYFEREHRQGNDIDEHDQWLIDSINETVDKRDALYILGDVAFSLRGLEKLNQLHCRNIKFVLGNHDSLATEHYQRLGKVLSGIVRYKEFWLTHCPIHPVELRDKINIHGHVHSNPINDDRYVNVCVESVKGVPISLSEIREKIAG